MAMFDDIKAITKDIFHLRAIEKDSVRNIILKNIQILDSQINSITELKEVDTIAYMKVVGEAVGKSRAYPDYYDKFLKSITLKTKQIEDGVFFGSIVLTLQRLKAINEEILKNLDTLVAKEKISIWDISVSAVAVFGFINDTTMYTTYLSYFLSSFVYAYEGTSKRFPKYRITYLNENMGMFSRSTSEMCEKRGAYAFLKELKNLKMGQKDLQLFTDDEYTLEKNVKLSGFKPSIQGAYRSGIVFMNIFRLIGDAYHMWERDRMDRMQQEKDWMEAQVKAIKLQAENVDKDSPEYRHLMNIVERYSANVAKSDKKIKDYFDKA